jgi:hypothetical protein
MKSLRTIAALALLAIGIAASAAELTLAPNQPADKTPLQWDASPSPDVTGYALFVGEAPGQYTRRVDVGNALTYTFTDLQRGKTYYFAATAYTADGLESDFSNEVSKHVKPIPASPATLKDPTVVKVTIETGTTPKGPWKEYAAVEVGAAPLGETYFRSKVDIEAHVSPPTFILTDLLFRHARTGPPALPN